MENNLRYFYDISLLSYFSSYEKSTLEDMIKAILDDEEELQRKKDDFLYRGNYEAVQQIHAEEYRDVNIRYVFDDNKKSGVFAYVLETEKAYILVYRGSEMLDETNHTTGWQDWKDNFRMFLKEPTYQQMKALQMLQAVPKDKPLFLCGHSKGGHLALYVAMACDEERFMQIAKVYAYNAPGIHKRHREAYQERIEKDMFLEKIVCVENENDCISSFFEKVKSPLLVASKITCNNLVQLYENHNLASMNITYEGYAKGERKHPFTKLVHHFVNDFFVHVKEEKLQRMIERMDDYFDSELSLPELYRVFLYHISKYTSFFDDLSYEEVATITLQDLLDQRKSKKLYTKLRQIDLKGNITYLKMRKKKDNHKPPYI